MLVLKVSELYDSRNGSAALRCAVIGAVKFTGWIILLLVVFAVSQNLCEYFQLGFWVSFIISVLVSIAFFLLWRLLDKKKPPDNTKKQDIH